MAYIETATPNTTMAALANPLASIAKYIRYRRTYAELKALPLDVLLDLDLYAGDLKNVARKAVYKA